MPSRQRRLLGCNLVVSSCWCVLVAIGCGPQTCVVSGQVTYRQQPLPRGSVTLFCQNGEIVSGLITPGGLYTIPNVPCGAARISVQTYPPMPPGFQLPQNLPPSPDAPHLASVPSADGSGKYVPIPDKYGNPEQSGLSLTVSGKQTEHNIDLGP